MEHNPAKIALTIQEAAQLSGLSSAYLYALSARGELPVSKVGTRVLILRSELETWLRSKIRATSHTGDFNEQ